MKTVTIGGGQGFWGDSPDAALHMIDEGSINYLACDYLAELTLSIMQRQKRKNPATGFARDFIDLFKMGGSAALEKGIRILTNAGGMNITGCVEALRETVKAGAMPSCRIGYVLGDDLMDKLPALMKQGIEFRNIDNGRKLEEITDRIVNVNVYHGHEPIEQCLQEGADVVVTGRAADSALFLAPLKHEFGWAADDWNALARGIMTGHLLECGGQGSGGNFDYDWRSVPDMDDLGFPLVEMTESSMTVTKPPRCGGLITTQVCKEQLLYEVHDPANYITPDVTVDLSRCTLDDAGPDRVAVGGLAGKPRPDQLKLCVGYHAGYKVVTYLSFAWPDAYEKAKAAGDILMKKMTRKNLKAEEIRIDYLGLNALHLDVADTSPEHIAHLNEVVLRIAIRTLDKDEAAKIIPEVSPLQLNGPPGASFFGGRAKVQEVIGLWPTFIPRDAVSLEARVVEA
ncbi:MAG: DUF1446 domain-containing protein [Planctomycetaceae bacterium]|nr:DUF1446 domain-containing protein [Planctomycetaceae bacterium]